MYLLGFRILRYLDPDVSFLFSVSICVVENERENMRNARAGETKIKEEFVRVSQSKQKGMLLIYLVNASGY